MKMLSICTIFHWFVRCAVVATLFFHSFFVSILFSLVFGLIWLKKTSTSYQSTKAKVFNHSLIRHSILFLFSYIFCCFVRCVVYCILYVYCIINLSTCIFLRIYFIHKAHITSYLAPMIHNPSFKRIFR